MNFSDEEEGENLKTVKDGIRSGSDNDQDERIQFEEQNDSCSSNDMMAQRWSWYYLFGKEIPLCSMDQESV